jgi:hypothetical protein
VVISVTRYFQLICFCAIFLDFPLPAQAEVEDGTHIDPATVASLMSWVENELGVKVPVLPQVVASRERFDRVLKRMAASYAGRPQAAYLPGTVYLDSLRWDSEESTQLSLLVHELVHHAQMFMPHKHWACAQAKEAEAYTLQNRWLEQRGHYPFVNAAWIERAASCPSHPEISLLAQR